MATVEREHLVRALLANFQSDQKDYACIVCCDDPMPINGQPSTFVCLRHTLCHWLARNQQPSRMSIANIAQANLSRVERWHGLKDWTALEWAGAMCGEAGEAANFAKKIKRLDSEIAHIDARMSQGSTAVEQRRAYVQGVLNEFADVVIYGVLLCSRVGATPDHIEETIRSVFNAKSEQYGFPERL